MDFRLLLPIVEKAAPLIGAALGGPVGSIGASLLASVFGANPQDPQDLLEKIQADPDAEFKMKQLELQHQDALRMMVAQKETIEVEDVEDARKSNKGNHILQTLMMVCVGPLVISAIAIVVVLSKISNDLVEHLLVVLFVTVLWLLKMIFKKVFDFYFGA